MPNYNDLQRGDWFLSPRSEEGWVQVVCPFGTCRHDVRDEFSCHVRQFNNFGEDSQFFVLAIPEEPCVTTEHVVERLANA